MTPRRSGEMSSKKSPSFPKEMLAAAGLLGALISAVPARAQAQYEIVHAFKAPPANPRAVLLEGSDGAFYGTTSEGGAGGMGTLFRYEPSTSTLTTLHSFNGANGATPMAGVIQGSDGALYGTTLHGAAGQGTVFRYDLSSSTLTTLHSFNGTDGEEPYAALLQGSDGALYGTTYGGGAVGWGTVFRYNLATSTLTTIHTFDGESGALPFAALIESPDGALYGTTSAGGLFILGTVFRYDLSNSTLTRLHSFDGSNGAHPYAALIQGSDGALYGTTIHGGHGHGTVFRYAPSSSTFTTLHNFDGPDGAQPYAALIQAPDGTLYGTTQLGGIGLGTMFRYDLGTSTLTILHSFNDTTGANPSAAVIQASDSALYGTTPFGGTGFVGTVFRYDLGTSTLATVHSFNSSNGSSPYAAVVQGLDGALYGTTVGGGASGRGTVFRYDVTTSTLTTLHSFNYPTGANPYAGLIQGLDGALYGTTYQGGASGAGTLFRYDLSTSTFATLHSFDHFSGRWPYAGLLQGLDGALYGTTYTDGGLDPAGTVFRYDLSSSTLTTLHTFNYTTGASPFGALIQGLDGALFGTTYAGGADGAGTVFRYDLAASTLATLHSFTSSDGSSPYAAVVQGLDGALYGTTVGGGASGGGTVFRDDLTTAILTTLHSFNGSNGAYPEAALIEGSDGALYGTTRGGGANGYGTVFRYEVATSTLTTLHNFNSLDGRYPSAAVMQTADGSLYGTARQGGPEGGGVIFRIILDSSPTDLATTKTGPSTVAPGQAVTYTITVANNGPGSADGAAVTDALPGPLTNATWTCSASAGSTCTGNGTGNIADSVALLNGGTATYTLTANVDAGFLGTLSNTASVAVPPAGSDPDLGNNSATWVTSVGQITPNVTWTAPAPITYGTPLDDTQLNATADVPGTFEYTPVSGTVLDVGTHTLSVTFTPTDGVTYESVTVTVSISVAQVPVSWALAYEGLGNVNGMAWTGSLVVAVGSNGNVWTTPDPAALAWSKRVNPIPGDAHLNAVTAGAAGVVAVGNLPATDGGPSLLTSPDGINWTERSAVAAAGSRNLRGVAFGSGAYVAVGGAGTIVTSPDGVTWTARASGTSSNLNGVVSNGSVFVAVGNGGIIRRSLDGGVTWSATDSGTSQALNAVAWLDYPMFVAVGNSGVIRTSPDGATWTAVASPTTNALFAVVAGRGHVVAAGNTSPGDPNSFFRSSDAGQNWAPGVFAPVPGTSRAVRSLVNVESPAIGNWFLAGTIFGSVWMTSIGDYWTDISPLPPGYLNDVAWNGAEFCAVGSTALRSVDGQQWAVSGAPLVGFFSGILWDGARFVAVGGADGQSRVATSPDCMTWTISSPPPLVGYTGDLQRVAFGQGVYVAGGVKRPTAGNLPEEPYLVTSPDLVTWTERPTGLAPGFRVYSMAYGAGRFAVALSDFFVNFEDALLTSDDGVTWTQQLWPFGLEGMNDMEFGGGLFFAGGGTLRRSANGVDWTMSYDAAPPFLVSIAYGDGRWVAGGTAGAVAASPDGSQWTAQVSVPTRHGLYGGATYSPELARFVIVAPGVIAYSTDPAPSSADLAISKSGPATVAPGQSLTYTIAVVNNGPGSATAAAVTDALPGPLPNATWTCSASPGSSCTPDGTGSIADGVSLLNGGTATYTLTATVDPGFLGPLSNTASVAVPPAGSDPDPGNNTSTWITSVSQITPDVTWTAPAPITYGTALDDTQLNATADVPGAFVYTPSSGTVLDAGTHTLSVTFTPTDGVTYKSVTVTVPISVAPATPTIIWADPAPIGLGTPLTSSQLNATVSPSIPGTFTYAPPEGTILPLGTHTLSVTFTPQDQLLPGGTVRFESAPDSVSLPPTAAFYSGPAFSWELWFRADAPPTSSGSGVTAGQTMMVAADGVGCEDFYLGFGSEFSPARTLTFIADGAGGCGPARDSNPVSYDPGTLAPGSWHHLVATQDYVNARTRLYVDGVLRASKTWSPAPISRPMNMTFGRWWDGGINFNQFQGSLDEVRIYGRELTPSEVAEHYADGDGQFGLSEPGLVGGWHLDEDSGTTVTDYSGAGRNGSFVGAPDRLPGQVALEYGANPNYTSATATVQIIVTDSTLPVVTVPADITAEATGPAGAAVTFTASAMDDVDGPLPVTCSPPSGATFPIAATTVTCTATDSSGNTGSADFLVTVQDTTPPVVTIRQGDVSYPVPAAIHALDDSQNLWLLAPTGNPNSVLMRVSASDGVVTGTYPVGNYARAAMFDGANIWIANYGDHTVMKLRASDGVLLGTFPVQYPLSLAFDGTNVWVGTAAYEVIRLSAADGSFVGSSSAGATVVKMSWDGEFMWSANFYGDSVSKLRASDGAQVLVVPVGVQPAALVSDGTAIWVAVSGENKVVKLDGQTGAVMGTYAVPGSPYSLVFDGTNIWVAWTGHVTKFRASDGANLGVETMAIASGEAPLFYDAQTNSLWGTGPFVITRHPLGTVGPTGLTVEATGPSGAAVTFTASATDLVDGTLPASCDHASGSTFPLGTTTVTCTATDAAGNTGSASFDVTVQDTTAPAVTVPPDMTVPAEDPSGAIVTFTPAPSAIDTVSGTVPVICAPLSGSVFAVGATTVDCTATDAAENTGSATFVVTVTAPEADLAITKTDGQTSAVVGQPITYTITVTNAGPNHATGARVVDNLPALVNGATWTCIGSGNATCAPSGSGSIDDPSVNIPVGGSVTYTVQGTVSPNGSGTLVNTATVSAPAGVTDSAPGNNTATDSDTLVDLTVPTVSVSQPNGGEVLFTGSAYVIQWTASDNVALDSFDVLASTNGGFSFTPIAGCTGLGAAVRNCNWTSPGPATTQGRIRVTARDTSGNIASDISNANFTIQGAAGSINVTSPNTAATWIVGITKQITWSHNLGAASTVDIAISRDAGATWNPIATAVPNATPTTGAFSWAVSGPSTAQALVRVSWTGNGAVQDKSNVTFTIQNGVVKVIQPDVPPPTNWKVGQTKTIKWNHNLGTAESVDIDFSANGGSTWSAVAIAVPNSGASAGTYSWTLPGPPTSLGLIRVRWTKNPTIGDVSDVVFVIN